MSLRDALNSAMKEAMKAKDSARLSTVRLILAAIKDRDIAARTEDSRAGVSDADIAALLNKMIRQRLESAETYDKGGRPELATRERAEITVIEEFLPQQLSDAEIEAAARAAIAETGAASIKDMGKVVAALKARYAGQMDFGKASGVVKGLLG